MPALSPNRPDISFYLPSLRGGGAERVVVTLANGLVDRGYRVDMVLTRAEGPCLADLDEKVRLVDLDSRRVLFSFLKLVAYLRRERPRTVFSSLWHTNVVALWAKHVSGSPARFVIRESSTPSVAQSTLPVLNRLLRRQLMRRFYPWANAIVAPSSGVVTDLSQYLGLSLDRISNLSNPVIYPGLYAKGRAQLEHPWLRPGEPPVVLSAGRLRHEKGFECLLRAFSMVRSEREARLMILGEGEERGKLERLIRTLDIEKDVVLSGFVANPIAYMARASVYVLSSYCEGSPNALIEAMAVGCPVVATDCSSGPKEILAGGRYGSLVPVGDPRALSRAILDTLRQPRLTRPADALNGYELAHVLDQYEGLLFESKHVGATGKLGAARGCESGPAGMQLLRRFVNFNRRMSAAFDRVFLPTWYAVDGNSDFATDFAPRFLRHDLRIFDVGGGKQPYLAPEEKHRLRAHVTGLDIDRGQLAQAAKGAYDATIVADICSYRGGGDADLVICQTLLEHVEDNAAAFEALASLLKPGGVLLVFAPSRTAVFACLNRWLPESWKRAILYAVYPETREAQGFRSFYDRCTPNELIELAGRNRLTLVERRCYFMSGYFSFLFPLYLLWRLWIVGFRAVRGAQAAETFSMALRKN